MQSSNPPPTRLPDDLPRLVDPALLRRPDGLTVACYTFPHYHRSALNDRLYGPGWTEYVLMRGCRPWFPGHHQPRTPLLGELDESDPATWERYNELAAGHGIDVFIWDWYWYDGEPALHEALENGFLRAPNRDRVRFAVMWTNHQWPLWYPTVSTDGTAGQTIVKRSPDDPAEMWRSLAYIVARYFHQPNYWTIDGRPVLVIWDAQPLRKAFGVEGTRAFLDDLRAFARLAGHVGIFIHASEGSTRAYGDLAAMGFDSYGGYNLVGNAADERPPEEALVDYAIAATDTVRSQWERADALSPLPYFPAVSPGWDASPRHLARPRPAGSHTRSEWPGSLIIVDETPAAFAALVRGALAFLNARPSIPPVMTVSCWNEWTEGHYLLPDTRLGYGMLEALAEAVCC